MGGNLLGPLSSNSKCHKQNIKHEKNIDSYPGCFADYFARRTCPFREPSCCWTQSSENASDKPLKYNVPTIVVEDNRPMGFTHYPQFFYRPQRAEHEKQYQQKLKVTSHQTKKHSILPMIILCDYLSLSIIIISRLYSSGAVHCA